MTVRVGMLAPITHPYPPIGYGPWERVTHDLTETLVEQGCEVVLFAPEGSITSAHLHPTVEAPLVAIPADEWRRVEDSHIATALAAAADLDLDIIHSHLHVHALALAGRWERPMVSTLHGVAWNRELHQLLRAYAHQPFVSLSDQERAFLPELNYVATIRNGIRSEDFPMGDGQGGYLAFVGRLAPEKAPHLAVEVANRSGRPLLMAGPIEDKYLDYAGGVLRRAGRSVDFLGPLDRPELSILLRDAAATLMPLEWDEPFGLVVVESLASGTPVIAWRRGAMPEIVDDGATGFLVDDVEGALSALDAVGALSRDRIAAEARRHFDRAVMASSYADVYERLALRSSPREDRRLGQRRS